MLNSVHCKYERIPCRSQTYDVSRKDDVEIVVEICKDLNCHRDCIRDSIDHKAKENLRFSLAL
jgi:hypothetical protein